MTEQDCQDEIDGYFNQINNLDKNYYYDYIISQISYYRVPKELEYELITLYYLYEYRDHWACDISTVDNRIKRTVKKITVESIVKKFIENPDIYFKLKALLDKRPNFSNSNSLDYIRTATKSYIWFSLHRSIREAPDFIKDSISFNL